MLLIGQIVCQLIHKAALFAKGKNQDNTTVAICRIR